MEWAKKNNVFYIPSKQNVDTYDLMQQADLIIINGGTAGLEAAALGKKVVNLGSVDFNSFCVDFRHNLFHSFN